ncbi:MAG: oxidoreductase [Thermoanaerobaculia bacterium]|nr:oxidoreductase [Thermoanaerobaculia bacterium]
MGWTADDLPDLAGRTFVVTGANSGLGFETARGLAAKGASVVMACRDLEKAAAARDRIRAEHAAARVETRALDLARLASVRDFAKAVADAHPRIDALVNNAGVMALPRRETADGYEMQIGTNHLGHFALTGLLLPKLLEQAGGRVVTVSSTMHKIGRIDFDDLDGRRSYRKWGAYGQSKLANLLFAYELQRRLEAAGARAASLASHPGYAATNLQFAGPRMEGSGFLERGAGLMNRLLSQTAAMGALPTLYAAAHPDAEAGGYYGPDGFMEMWGHPRRVASSRRSQDEAVAERLWRRSEELTGVRFDALAGG